MRDVLERRSGGVEVQGPCWLYIWNLLNECTTGMRVIILIQRQQLSVERYTSEEKNELVRFSSIRRQLFLNVLPTLFRVCQCHLRQIENYGSKPLDTHKMKGKMACCIMANAQFNPQMVLQACIVQGAHKTVYYSKRNELRTHPRLLVHIIENYTDFTLDLLFFWCEVILWHSIFGRFRMRFDVQYFSRRPWLDSSV